jgi:restriction system protein
MAVPKYDELMLPYLEVVSDGEEYKNREVEDALAAYFQLSDEDRQEMLASGNQRVMTNRVSWACVYLRKAGLIERTRRGWYRITDLGLDVLESKPDKIDRNYLMQFTSFAEFQKRDNPKQAANTDANKATPVDALEANYLDLRQKLAHDLLERIRDNSPQFFENLVIDLMLAMGYGGSRRDAGKATRLGRDGGIDGVIKEDRLGLNNIYIQAKRWENTVGRPEVQAFSGALDMHNASRGVFITTSQFSTDALDFVERIGKKIILIDGEQLAELMIDFGVGVTTKATYVVYEVDENYFDNE